MRPPPTCNIPLTFHLFLEPISITSFFNVHLNLKMLDDRIVWRQENCGFFCGLPMLFFMDRARESGRVRSPVPEWAQSTRGHSKMHPFWHFTVFSFVFKANKSQMYTTFVCQRKGNFLPFPNLEFDYHYQLPLTPSDCFITHHFFGEICAKLHQTHFAVQKVPQTLRFLKGLKLPKLKSKFWANRSISCHSITILVIKSTALHKKRNSAPALRETSSDHNMTISHITIFIISNYNLQLPSSLPPLERWMDEH